MIEIKIKYQLLLNHIGTRGNCILLLHIFLALQIKFNFH